MTDRPHHCLIVHSQLPHDPRAAGLLADAHALGLAHVTHIEGALSPTDQRRLATELLSDPIAQAFEWRSVGSDGVIRFLGADHHARVIETALRPGVTDPAAEQIVRCAKMLSIRFSHIRPKPPVMSMSFPCAIWTPMDYSPYRAIAAPRSIWLKCRRYRLTTDRTIVTPRMSNSR
jgi:hypothetical protein